MHRSIRRRPYLLIAACAAMLAAAAPTSAAPGGICWQNGVTPGGHAYQVRYVPRQAISIAASGQPHNYAAVAVAFPGWIWVADDAPCGTIPWDHEEMHLDGWRHNPDGRWIDRKPDVREASDGERSEPWMIVKFDEEYRLLRERDVAAAASD